MSGAAEGASTATGGGRSAGGRRADRAQREADGVIAVNAEMMQGRWTFLSKLDLSRINRCQVGPCRRQQPWPLRYPPGEVPCTTTTRRFINPMPSAPEARLAAKLNRSRQVSTVERLRYTDIAFAECKAPAVVHRPASVTEIIGTADAQRRRSGSQLVSLFSRLARKS